jgi:Leucine-rich repeat (LRR) protein
MTITSFNPNLPSNTAVTPVPGEPEGGSSSQMTLFYIPEELLGNIFSRLSWGGIKNVSLTCKAFSYISNNLPTSLPYLNRNLAEKLDLSIGEITGYRRMFGSLSLIQIFLKCPLLETLDLSNTRISRFTVSRILQASVAAGCPLHHLILTNCRYITGPVPLNVCNQLQSIDISCCRSITSLPGLNNQKSLQTFQAAGCKKLKGEFDICELPQLRSLHLAQCILFTVVRGPAQDVLLDNLDSYYDVNRKPQHTLVYYRNNHILEI